MSHSFQNFSVVLGNVLSVTVPLSILEKWKSPVDNHKRFGALLTDLSKAFDCLSHDLLISKVNAYEFSIKSLRFLQNYFSYRKKKKQNKFSIQVTRRNFIQGSPGINLGPLLFNIFLCYLFFIMEHIEHTIHYRKRCGRCYFQISKFVRITFSMVYG